jgi:hypothetical protein
MNGDVDIETVSAMEPESVESEPVRPFGYYWVRLVGAEESIPAYYGICITDDLDELEGWTIDFDPISENARILRDDFFSFIGAPCS